MIESKDPSKQPRIVIVNEQGNPIQVEGTNRFAVYRLQTSANIMVAEGTQVEVGVVLSKMQRETTKTKDITGGLPRVAELFEARKPSNASQIADVSGTIEFGSEVRGSRRIVIRPDDGSDPITYTVPKGRFVIVNEGDYVRAGEALMDGPSNPHDLLRVMGPKVLAQYICDEVQDVYRLQGVTIDDKHIEVIVSQMLKKVEVTSVGDSDLIAGDTLTKGELREINEKLEAQGLELVEARPLLLGITQALTQATLEGKKDMLRGLKENVIMGRLIPAGTGIPRYRDFDAATPLKDELEESISLSF